MEGADRAKDMISWGNGWETFYVQVQLKTFVFLHNPCQSTNMNLEL